MEKEELKLYFPLDFKRNQRIGKVAKFAENYMNQFTNKSYHNFGHALDVAEDSMKLIDLYNKNNQKYNRGSSCGTGFIIDPRIKKQGREEILVASLLHDLRNDFDGSFGVSGEKYSSGLSKSILPSFGYSVDFAESVRKYIMATEFNYVPKNIGERIIKDADLSSLGKNNFWDVSELVRNEIGKAYDKKWLEGRVNFLEKHKWHTKEAKELWGEGSEKNLFEAKRRHDLMK